MPTIILESIQILLKKYGHQPSMKVPFNDFKALYAPLEMEYQLAFKRVLHSGWYILGDEVVQFEKEFAEYLGVKYCVGVANGLEALQISLLAIGIGVKDEVITTPLSAFATTLAIHSVGATPVFVDTTDDGLIDIDGVEKAITSKTKAILPVHLYGNAVNLKKLKFLCDQHSLLLIEDAAQAHGTEYNKKKVGTQGTLNCFSFYPTKNLGALGDGGAIVTNSKNLAISCKKLRDYGQTKKYFHSEFGLNSRLDEVQAAFLRVRLKYLDIENKKRLMIAEKYRSYLKDCSQIKFISPQDGGNCHLCVIRTPQRDALQNYLLSRDIESNVHYPLIIPDQPVYKGFYKKGKMPNSRKLVSEVLSLPCHPYLKEEHVAFVSEEISKYFRM